MLRYILYTCPNLVACNPCSKWLWQMDLLRLQGFRDYEPKSICYWTWATCTHGAHKIHSGKTAKDLYLTTCTHGAHNIHSCKNKRCTYSISTISACTDEALGRVYRSGPPDRVWADEAVTLAKTLARTIRVVLVHTWPQNLVHARVYLRPQKARGTVDPLTSLKIKMLPDCLLKRTACKCLQYHLNTSLKISVATCHDGQQDKNNVKKINKAFCNIRSKPLCASIMTCSQHPGKRVGQNACQEDSRSKWIDMTCKEKLTSNAVPCMPPFSVGETNPLQCLSMFDWHASVQHQAHLWPFAFGPLCQKLLQHICCFHKSFLFSSQSNHKVLVLLVDDLQFCMASLAYAMNVGLFGAKKFQLKIIFTFIEFKPTTKVPGRRGRKWRRRRHCWCLHFQSLHCCNCSILFGLLSSLTCDRLKVPLANVKAPQARKTLSRGRDTIGGRDLPQEEIAAAFAAVEARDDWLPGGKKLKWLLIVWVFWDVYCKTKEGRKQPKKSLQILPASADLHIFELLKVHSWELSDLQTTGLWPLVRLQRQWKHGIALLFAMPFWIELGRGNWNVYLCLTQIVLHVPIKFSTATLICLQFVVSLNRHKRKRWCIARFKANHKQISLATKGFQCHPEASSKQWTATTAGMG